MHGGLGQPDLALSVVRHNRLRVVTQLARFAHQKPRFVLVPSVSDRVTPRDVVRRLLLAPVRDNTAEHARLATGWT